MEGINIDNASVERFKELIAPIYNEIYRYIFSIVKNKSFADDILQSTLLNAYSHLYQLRDESKFKYWILKIAKREAISLIRKYNQEVAVTAIEYELSYDEEYASPDDILISNELKETLIEIVNALNPEDRDIINLYYFNELPLQDIAQLLNMNENTIRTRHRNIKKKIFKELMVKGLINERINNNPWLKTGGAK